MEISKKRFSFEEMLDSNFLTVEMKSQITQELIEILMEKMRNYTGGDSSLSKERTQSLMDSILYTLSFFLRNMDIQETTALFTNQNITEIYQQSYQYLLQELHNLYIRVIELQHHQLHIPFRVYQDTIGKGMQAFFEVYNFDYCSQDIVSMIKK